MTFAQIHDKFRWLSIAVAFHPFHWGLTLDKDARDKSLAVTVGPFTLGANW